MQHELVYKVDNCGSSLATEMAIRCWQIRPKKKFPSVENPGNILEFGTAKINCWSAN